MRRDACAGCHVPAEARTGLNLIPVLNLGATPLADDFPTVPASVAQPDRWPLELLHCVSCGLVQLGEVVPDALLYGANYGFHTGHSPASRAYFRAYARWLGQWRHDGLTVELACNDGTLLQHLAGTGRTLGIEPAAGPAEVARGRGLDVINAPFDLRQALDIRREYGRARLIVANNVLAHVADPRGFLAAVRALLDADGVFVFEVQYFPDLLLGNGFDLVYHEHRSFFSVDPLARMCAAEGMPIQRVMATSAQGGSVRIVAGNALRDASLTRWREQETWLRGNSNALAGLQVRAQRLRGRLREAIGQQWVEGRTVVGLAAPAKATTLLSWCGLDVQDVARVHDLTPAKDGRYIPGTDIPITLDPLLDPESTTALVLAHNYLPSIIRRNLGWLDAGGRLLTPLPAPMVL